MKKYSMISLFTGCGGMDIGFEGGFLVNHQSLRNPNMTTGSVNSAGQVRVKPTKFTTVFACDIRPSAKIAWETYFKRQNIYHLQSIVDLVKHSRDGSFSFPEADIVTGGFPCQDFSVSGKRRGFKSDRTHLNVSSQESLPSTETRGMLYYWMREVINIVKPKIFIAENVKGLVSLGDVKEIIAKDFRSVEPGYHVLEPQVLHAGNYGVPQNRERVFFIGVRQDVMDAISVSGAIAYPDPSHNVATGDIVTGYDYIKDLAEPEAATDRSQRAYSKAKWCGKHCQGQTEIKTDGLAPTIRSEHHGNIEFRRLSQDNGGKIKHEFHLPQRRLTVRECARIQTFPDDFEFVQTGISASEAYKLIGNAVPPLLAYHLAKKVEEVLDIASGQENTFFDQKAA